MLRSAQLCHRSASIYSYLIYRTLAVNLLTFDVLDYLWLISDHYFGHETVTPQY